jgi:huckebein
MTLIPCNAQSEKLFRPWDSDCGASARTTSSKESSPAAAIILAMKEEQHDRLLVVSSPESSPSGAHSSSSSGASSCDESEASSSSSSSLGAGSPAASAYSYSAIQQAYSAHMMSLGHHHQPSPFLASGWMPTADTFHPHHLHHHHHLPQHFQPEAPSMERFLASLESSPEALHPSRLAALGMGPNEIGELYQMAGFKPLIQHHYPSAAMAGTTSSSSHHHHHNPSSGSGNKKQRPKRFRCPHCQVAFSNNGQLKGHVRSHTGTFICNFLFHLKPIVLTF